MVEAAVRHRSRRSAPSGTRRFRTSVADAFAADPGRFATMHACSTTSLRLFQAARHGATLASLIRLARAADVEAKREAMFRGDLVNSTERRAALHTALRNFSGAPVHGRGPRRDAGDRRRARQGSLAFADDVREGRLRGALGQPMTDVVNIGIGGSDLGPAMATRALAPYAPAEAAQPFRLQRRRRRHRRHAARARSRAHPVHRLLEDLHDAGDDDQRARARAPGSSARSAKRRSAIISRRFRPISTRSPHSASRRTACSASGTGSAAATPIWSSIGLPLAIAIGPEQFEEFLHGGYEVDRHFRDAPIVQQHSDADGAARRVEPQHSRLRQRRR